MDINNLTNIIQQFIDNNKEFSSYDVYKVYNNLNLDNLTYNKCKKYILSAVNEMTTLYNYKKTYTTINKNVYTKYTPINFSSSIEFNVDIDCRGRIYLPKYISKYINVIENEYVTVKYSNNYIYIYPLDSDCIKLNSYYKSTNIKVGKSDSITISVGKTWSINDKMKIHAYDDCLIIPFFNE